jgi:predicted nucleotidyltransferase
MIIIPQSDDDAVKCKQANPEMLEKILARVLSVIKPEKVILFGSAARGDTGPDSDIDLLVIAKVTHRRKTAQRIYQKLVGVGAPIDIIVATPGDMKKYKDRVGTIFPAILREGKVVYAS